VVLRALYHVLITGGDVSPGPSRTEFEVNPLDGGKELAGAIIGVVDDDEGIRVAVDGLLRSAGFRVVTFSSAKALLDSVHLHMLACLILDLHIPDMDALSLQRRLADDGCQIPIIILTAHGDSETRAQAVNEGAVAFLTKPFDGELLLAAATRAVARIT
jgi:FixJ family two-component response regulator